MPTTTINTPVCFASSEMRYPHSRTTTDIVNAPLRLSPQLVTFFQDTEIPNSDLVLKYPLGVEIETTLDGFVVRSGVLDEEAFGVTYADAYLDFLTSLRDRYHSLSRRQGPLSTQDHAVLERLRNLLGPKQG